MKKYSKRSITEEDLPSNRREQFFDLFAARLTIMEEVIKKLLLFLFGLVFNQTLLLNLNVLRLI